MSKTSRTESSSEIDEMLRNEAISVSNLARSLAAQGYNPYEGNTVAAMQPAQTAAMGMANQFADAFGMEGAAGQGLPQATDDGSGILGYSPEMMMREAQGPAYDERKAALDAWFAQAGQPTDYQAQKTAGGGGKK